MKINILLAWGLQKFFNIIFWGKLKIGNNCNY
jgi:hypothetical protein